MSHPPRSAATLSVVSFIMLSAVAGARAQTPLLPEREPNDTAAAARAFEAPALLQGSLGAGDVDVFVLVVDDDAATQRFDLTLEGPIGTTAALGVDGGAAPRITLATTQAEPAARARAVLLAPDRYSIVVRGATGPYSLTVGSTRLRPVTLPAGRERARADRIRLHPDAAYLLPAGDAWLRWAPAAGSYHLDATVMGDGPLRVALEDAAGAELGSTAKGPLSAVTITGGEHYLRIQGPEGALVVIAPRKADAVDEPSVIPLVVGQAVTGQAEAKRPALHVLRAEGVQSLYTLRASGPGVKSLAWATPAGETLMEVRATGSGATLDKLHLPPGDHRFVVSGPGGAYRLEVQQVPLPASFGKAPSLEREPNGGGPFLDELRFATPRAGLANTPDDQDLYRFHAPTETVLRVGVTATSPLSVRWENGATTLATWAVPASTGAAWATRVRVPAGDHVLGVRPASAAGVGASYIVALELEDPFDQTIVEPNDRPHEAAPLPADLVAPTSGAGQDWFLLPALSREATITVTPPARGQVRAFASDKPRVDLLAKQGDAFTGKVPAGVDVRLQIDTRDGAPGVARVVFEGGPAPAPLTPPGVEVIVKLIDDTAQAYATGRQTLRGELTITGKAAGSVSLEARTSDPRWRVALGASAAELAAGKRVVVPFEVQVAPDAPADRPVRVDVGARASAGGWARGHTFGVARALAPAVRSAPWSPLPDALLGGVDVARGGRFVDAAGGPAKGGGKLAALVQGGARHDRAFEMKLTTATRREDMPTVELTRAARVVGVTLEAVGPELRTAVRDFAVWLSADGATWTEAALVGGGRLEAREGEQAFVLSEPRQARFARLEIKSSHAGVPRALEGEVTLGAFKVIADPSTPLHEGRGFDLATEALGGHVVRTTPPEALGAPRVGLVDRPLEMVLGFHHARAAKVAEIVWEDAPGTTAAERIGGLTLFASTEGPIGPWREIGRLAAPGRVTLSGDAAWVRYLKVEGAPPPKRGRYAVPSLRVYEAPVSAFIPGVMPGYRSILGEWGPFRRESELERGRSLGPVAEPSARGNQSRKTAAPLGAQPVQGRVQRGRVEDWYVVTMPAGHTRLTLSASAQPTLDCDLELSDAAGVVIAPRASLDGASSVERSWDVLGGKPYYVRVWQPPSSVVFAWDTSGSVTGWVPIVRNAIQRFAETVTPGQEAVHLLPFGGGPLLVDWESRVEHLWSALARYLPSASSESERALRVASDMLAEARGTRAVMILTDALSPKDHDLWRALGEARPRVFAAGVAAGLEGVGQDRLESWASAADGEYAGVSSRGQLDVFFERASTRLRQAASYTLAAKTEAIVALTPGTLEVVDDRPQAKARAIELVVDLSGSMLEPMKGGRTRIAVAREILADTVANAVPAGARVAVRVFGRVGADGCGTELAVPLGPPAAAQAAVGKIEAKKWAMTPIAAALKAVGGDLAGVEGDKIVVLLTDGRETCGGDPAAVLKELQDQGLAVRVNIVGFALSSGALKRTFEALADAGGGRYFDAADGDGLAQVLGAAVRVTVLVRDAAGAVVAEGAVGGAPISLAKGTYRVEVQTSPPIVFDNVEVRDGDHRRLSLAGGR